MLNLKSSITIIIIIIIISNLILNLIKMILKIMKNFKVRIAWVPYDTKSENPNWAVSHELVTEVCIPIVQVDVRNYLICWKVAAAAAVAKA